MGVNIKPAYFFENILCVPNGQQAGQPFKLLPWQADALATIYGESESPVISEYYLSMPKKQGKTAFAAGLLLYQLVAEPHERCAEIYSAAGSEKQAKEIYKAAKSMVRFSPKLRALEDTGKLQVFTDSMVYHAETGDRTYRALSNQAGNHHGINPSVSLIDELHNLEGRSGSELVEVLTTSQITRRAPLTVYLTHAGSSETSIASDKEKLISQYANDVLPAPSGFAYRIYRASDAHPWDSEEAFAEANPVYGTLISRDAYEKAATTARQTPNLKRSYMRYHLNRWVSKSASLVNMDDWKACEQSYSEEDLIGRVCYGGFDASTYDDLTAFSLVFPSDDGTTFRTLVHAFIPEERLADKEQRDQVPYFEWSELGHLHLTPGSVIDADYVLEVMLDAAEKYELREIAYDPHRARGIISKLTEAGIPCLEHRTGMVSMAEPTAQFLKHVVAHTLHHNGNPLLTWNVGNLQARTDVSGNTAPKKGSRAEKIDAAFALILALGIATEQSQPSKPFVSVYASGQAMI
jgi:phage terminase large subunit-like protein